MTIGDKTDDTLSIEVSHGDGDATWRLHYTHISHDGGAFVVLQIDALHTKCVSNQEDDE